MLLLGTLGSDFDIFAASGESIASSGKPVPRPIRVRVCLVAQFDFSAPHLIRVRGQWLYSGRKFRDINSPLITPENGGDETSSPSPPNFYLL